MYHFLKLAFALLALPINSFANVNAIDSSTNFDSINFESLSYSDYKNNTHTVFFANAGNSNQTGVLFVHGTPGGWDAFSRYLQDTELRELFFLTSLDRPGWGNSPLDSKQIDGSFALQSAAIGAIFSEYPEKKWIIVGHSLGASIAPQIALDYPDKVIGVLLLAGSLKPSLGSPRWYNRAASTWVVASLIGTSMKHSNREIMGLKSQLEAMDTQIKSQFSNAKISILQGKKDKLVSPKNPSYVLSEWSNHFTSIEVLELPDEGHFLPWRQYGLVKELIIKLALGS